MSTLFSPFYSQLLPQPAHGTVDRLISVGQTGRVKYRGTYWSAQLYQPEYGRSIPTGAPVQIMAIRGITLLVTPIA